MDCTNETKGAVKECLPSPSSLLAVHTIFPPFVYSLPLLDTEFLPEEKKCTNVCPDFGHVPNANVIRDDLLDMCVK